MQNFVISDFINGKGLFEGDPLAMEFAQKMSTNQFRRFKRYGIVPRDFLEYLAVIKVIAKNEIPKRRLKIGGFLDFLRFYPYRNEQARSYGETLFKKIIQGEVPWLKNSFGQSDFVWEKLENARNLRKRREARI